MNTCLRFVALVLVLCAMIACRNKAVIAELDDFRAQAKGEAQNKEVVSRFFDEFNKGNLEIFDELCAPEYRYYLPSYSPKPWTREEQIEEEKATFRAFPDFKVRIDKFFAEGDTVITWGAITGTHLGEYQGLPPTGNKFEVGTMMIWKIKDGKVYEARQEANFLDLMQPLGMELKPKEGRLR